MNNARHLILPLLLIAAACGGPVGGDQPPLAGASIGGPFTLVSGDGRTVTERDFAGRYSLIYFGYTYCPDVCPVDLQALMKGFRAFEAAHPAAAAKVRPIFITVDPARDTPAAVKQYAAAFHPRLIGLTGSEAQIAAAADTFAVYRKRVETEGASDYLMDHARTAILFDPDGKPIAIVPQDGSPQVIAEELARWVR